MTRSCPDCGAKPGDLHVPGCDVERCPRCGGQSISCDCIYEVCGMDPAALEEAHPAVFANGPTKQMYAKWDAAWAQKRIPWTGEWPGVAECREFGWYCKMVPGEGWVRCEKDDPEATEDLNRLHVDAVWNADTQRFILREQPTSTDGAAA